jgi:hypothetical protein
MPALTSICPELGGNLELLRFVNSLLKEREMKQRQYITVFSLIVALTGLSPVVVAADAGRTSSPEQSKAASASQTWTDSRSAFIDKKESASATCTTSTWDGTVPNQYASISCSLSDTSCDGHSVYVKWWQDGYGKVRLSNRDGCNHTTSHSDSRYNGDGSFGTLYWQVCVDIQFDGDECSDIVSHRTH